MKVTELFKEAVARMLEEGEMEMPTLRHYSHKRRVARIRRDLERMEQVLGYDAIRHGVPFPMLLATMRDAELLQTALCVMCAVDAEQEEPEGDGA